MVMKMLFLFLISLNKIMNLSSSQVLLPIKLVIPDTSTLFCLSNSIFIFLFSIRQPQMRLVQFSQSNLSDKYAYRNYNELRQFRIQLGYNCFNGTNTKLLNCHFCICERSNTLPSVYELLVYNCNTLQHGTLVCMSYWCITVIHFILR